MVGNVDDVLIKIGFVMTNEKSVQTAINNLQKLGVMENYVQTKMTTYGAKGKQTAYQISAANDITAQHWMGVQNQVEKVMTKTGRLKNASQTTLQVVAREGQNAGQKLGMLDYIMGMLPGKASKLGKVSWGLTWMSLSLLGVYFSAMGLVNLLSRSLNTIITPLADIDTAVEKLATGFAFANIFGIDLSQWFGDFGGIIKGLIPVWEIVTVLLSALSIGIIKLGIAVFSNSGFLAELVKNVLDFAAALSKPEMVSAVQTLILSLAQMLPTFAKMLPMIANFAAAFAPFLPYMIILGGIAALLMPVLSILSALIQVVGSLGGAWAALKAVAITVGAAISALGVPLWAVVAIVIALGAIIYTVWNNWDAIIKNLGSLWDWLGTKIRPIYDMLLWISNNADPFRAIATSTANMVGFGTTSSGNPTSSNIQVTQYVTNNNTRDTNTSDLTDALAKEFAYKIRRT